MTEPVERRGSRRADSAYSEQDLAEAIEREEIAAHAQLSALLDSLATAQAAIADARGILRALYAGPTASHEVESFLAPEAEDQDIVAHLADSARRMRSCRRIARRSPHQAVRSTRLRRTERTPKDPALPVAVAPISHITLHAARPRRVHSRLAGSCALVQTPGTSRRDRTGCSSPEFLSE
ncbi:hypothetical protein [Rhodococcus qingshengii]|uniref:hypothetical protein n=1 Tax=Rhodococcus qingshengii TaxID=334542 RepID=UPI00279BACF8|nr:hypothetical protein PI247_31105 [Rhodococcus qingshengii]